MPYDDIIFQLDPSKEVILSGNVKSDTEIQIPFSPSYSSFVLLPLLNMVLKRRCLLVGGPGRGKTASAILMGQICGYSLLDVRRAMQHGHPQMTIADLLGNPLPADLVKAEQMDQIKIAWRKWLSMRVKIIDEYNRIPTRTQSALLTVLGDNYAEMLDQVYECPDSAWYLTCNDDQGGGTYPVIEALKDRLDIVVRAPHFNMRHTRDLIDRMEHGEGPNNKPPAEVVFSETDCDQALAEIMAMDIPQDVRRRLEFFGSQFEFCNQASPYLEYKTKDVVKLSPIEYRAVLNQDTSTDKLKDIGLQTRNGLSIRALQSIVCFAKALAWFRGKAMVSVDDIRQVAPFVLHDKLVQFPEHPWFSITGNEVYRVDRISWIRTLFNMSLAEFDKLNLDKDDPVDSLEQIARTNYQDLSKEKTENHINEIEQAIQKLTAGRKMYGHLYDDVMRLKQMHQSATQYLNWVSFNDIQAIRQELSQNEADNL